MSPEIDNSNQVSKFVIVRITHMKKKAYISTVINLQGAKPNTQACVVFIGVQHEFKKAAAAVTIGTAVATTATPTESIRDAWMAKATTSREMAEAIDRELETAEAIDRELATAEAIDREFIWHLQTMDKWTLTLDDLQFLFSFFTCILTTYDCILSDDAADLLRNLQLVTMP
ncbi:hypothetical protein ACJX0J_019629 [Zea mays]